MSEIIENYYCKKKLHPDIARKRAELFGKYKDIEEEFIYWINNNSYNENNPVVVEGYNAQRVATINPMLSGEAVYSILISLREKPEKTKRDLENGFKIM